LETDHTLDLLLSLHGHEFRYESGYWIKLQAQRVATTTGRPAGIKYSLTLHDPEGRRVYGLDNAHGIRQQKVYDHRHVDHAGRIIPYEYRGATELLEEFYRQVDRILTERDLK